MHTLNKSTYILAVCLSALAGCVDAIGFLHLGGVFISFMSGNSTRLAVDLAGGGAGAMLLAMVLLLFVLGTMLGVFVRHFARAASPISAVLAAMTILLVCAALCAEAGHPLMAIACMTLAMGAENAVFQRNGDVVIGLTYMTGTLVKIGQRLAGALLGGDKWAWAPYVFLWAGLLTGGVAGAMLFSVLGLRSLWVAVEWAACLAVATVLGKRRLMV